jgi:hypothetical protein
LYCLSFFFWLLYWLSNTNPNKPPPTLLLH